MGETSRTLQDAAVVISLTGFVVLPLVSLLHELGHALVALRVAPGLVQIHVGRPPGLRVKSARLDRSGREPPHTLGGQRTRRRSACTCVRTAPTKPPP